MGFVIRCRYGKVQRQLAIGKTLLEGGGTFDHQVKIALFGLSFASSLVNRLPFLCRKIFGDSFNRNQVWMNFLSGVTSLFEV